MKRFSIGACAAILAVCGFAEQAPAQNALGDGQGLDNNLRQGSAGRNTQVRDYAAEARYRNAIVTGNAPSGASFRGDVGYSAPDEFRGALGSNDIFNFQRDSLLSGLAGRGLRGADAIQFQRQFSTGGLIDERTGVPIIRRAGAGASLDMLEPSTNRPISTFDPFSLRPGSLRSASQFMVTNSLSPRMLGAMRTEEGAPQFAMASPLRGVVSQSTPDYPSTMQYGLEQLDLERWQGPTGEQRESEREQDALRGLDGINLPGASDDSEETERQTRRQSPLRQEGLSATDDASNRTSDRIEQERASSRVEAERYGSQDVLEQLRGAFEQPQPQQEPGAADQSGQDEQSEPRLPGEELLPRGFEPEDNAPAPQQSQGDSRSSTPQSDQQQDAGAAESSMSDFETQMQELRERLLRRPEMPGGNQDDAPFQDKDERQKQREWREKIAEDLARSLLTRIEPQVDSLAPPKDTETIVARQMRDGERLLAEGKWFDAEERFAGALRLRPDDPFAAAGRLHAQVGAGLFRSATRNLERLLRTHPEMISVRFDDALLPSDQRLNVVRRLLREHVGRENEFGRDCGLLLAYIGRQSGNQQDIRDGLAAVERISDAIGAGEDPLIDVIRTVWLKEDGAASDQ